jgi:hypothetical protein
MPKKEIVVEIAPLVVVTLVIDLGFQDCNPTLSPRRVMPNGNVPCVVVTKPLAFMCAAKPTIPFLVRYKPEPSASHLKKPTRRMSVVAAETKNVRPFQVFRPFPVTMLTLPSHHPAMG